MLYQFDYPIAIYDKIIQKVFKTFKNKRKNGFIVKLRSIIK